MNTPVTDMSLVSTRRSLCLLDAMASSFTGILAENLLYRRFSFITNSFFVGIYDESVINDECIRLLHAKNVQIQPVMSQYLLYQVVEPVLE
jgi:hypothetical protein